MHVLAAGASSTSIPWAAIIPLLLVEVLFDAYCIVDMIRHPRVRALPRWAWILITLGANPLGGIGYLIFGRSEDR